LLKSQTCLRIKFQETRAPYLNEKLFLGV